MAAEGASGASSKPSVLFLCTQNACRSQMAEAWTRTIFGDEVRVLSAGVRPAARVDPMGVEAMKEKGIAMDSQYPKTLDDLDSQLPVDLLVTVCSRAADECPKGRGARRIAHAPFEDPPALAKATAVPLDAYRQGRDEIERFIRTQLPAMLGVSVPAKADAAISSPQLDSGQIEDAVVLVKEAISPQVSSSVDEVDVNVSEVGVWHELSLVDRLLPVWIIGAMVLGVLLGYFTDIGAALDVATIASVNFPVALGLWLMMWPVLCKVKYELLGDLCRDRRLWREVAFSVMLNWCIGPFLMTGLAWLTLPDLLHYRNGVVLVGLARCIAMVLIWNQLARGHAEYCAILVAVNSILQIVLYAPLTLLFVGVFSNHGADGLDISFWAVARSVLIFLGAPLVAGIATRYLAIAIKGREWLEQRLLPVIGPIALIALVYTVLVLFGLQGRHVIEDIGNVVRVAVPMVLYFALTWFSALWAAHRRGSSYELAVTQAFTASSNNFELAIAIAVASFGVHSAEALAATIGPLIEVPALLALVYVALWLHRRWKWATGQSQVADARNAVCEGSVGSPANDAQAENQQVKLIQTSEPSPITT